MEARMFLDNYQVTDLEKDPLPIKVLRNSIIKEEIPGQAVHWGFDYLDQRSCPLTLITQLLEKLNYEVLKADFTCCMEGTGSSLDDTSNPVEICPKYEPLKLMQAVIKILDEICLKEREDHQDSVDGTVDSPDLQPNVFAVSYNNIKNQRRFMEDRMTILPRMDRIFKLSTPVSYFAVFDGHNGSEAAAYCAAQMHQYLIQSINQHQDVISSISEAFESVDAVFVQKCRSGKIKSGSTVVLSLLMSNKLYVAWVGDSQAVLVKRNEVNNLVTPHKPERKDEIDRIKNMGGEVIQMNGTYRVNGNLAVSRAIGDADDKAFIISTPDMKMLELDGTEEFLVLACDGLWDEITPEVAAQIVRQQVVADPYNISGISQELIVQAKRRGSGDNISVIVVFLEPVESIKNRYEGQLDLEIQKQQTDNTSVKAESDPLGLKPSDFIESDGESPITVEFNGHGKDCDQLVDFLSFGSSRESGAQLISDDTGNHSGEDELDKKEEVEELSDAESDDEWQFEKPPNHNVTVTNIVAGNDEYPENPFAVGALAEADAGIDLSRDQEMKDAFMAGHPAENITESSNPFSTENLSEPLNPFSTEVAQSNPPNLAFENQAAYEDQSIFSTNVEVLNTSGGGGLDFTEENLDTTITPETEGVIVDNYAPSTVINDEVPAAAILEDELNVQEPIVSDSIQTILPPKSDIMSVSPDISNDLLNGFGEVSKTTEVTVTTTEYQEQEVSVREEAEAGLQGGVELNFNDPLQENVVVAVDNILSSEALADVYQGLPETTVEATSPDPQVAAMLGSETIQNEFGSDPNVIPSDNIVTISYEAADPKMTLANGEFSPSAPSPVEQSIPSPALIPSKQFGDMIEDFAEKMEAKVDSVEVVPKPEKEEVPMPAETYDEFQFDQTPNVNTSVTSILNEEQFSENAFGVGASVAENVEAVIDFSEGKQADLNPFSTDAISKNPLTQDFQGHSTYGGEQFILNANAEAFVPKSEFIDLASTGGVNYNMDAGFISPVVNEVVSSPTVPDAELNEKAIKVDSVETILPPKSTEMPLSPEPSNLLINGFEESIGVSEVATTMSEVRELDASRVEETHQSGLPEGLESHVDELGEENVVVDNIAAGEVLSHDQHQQIAEPIIEEILSPEFKVNLLSETPSSLDTNLNKIPIEDGSSQFSEPVEKVDLTLTEKTVENGGVTPEAPSPVEPLVVSSTAINTEKPSGDVIENIAEILAPVKVEEKVEKQEAPVPATEAKSSDAGKPKPESKSLLSKGSKSPTKNGSPVSKTTRPSLTSAAKRSPGKPGVETAPKSTVNGKSSPTTTKPAAPKSAAASANRPAAAKAAGSAPPTKAPLSKVVASTTRPAPSKSAAATEPKTAVKTAPKVETKARPASGLASSKLPPGGVPRLNSRGGLTASAGSSAGSRPTTARPTSAVGATTKTEVKTTASSAPKPRPRQVTGAPSIPSKAAAGGDTKPETKRPMVPKSGAGLSTIPKTTAARTTAAPRTGPMSARTTAPAKTATTTTASARPTAARPASKTTAPTAPRPTAKAPAGATRAPASGAKKPDSNLKTSKPIAGAVKSSAPKPIKKISASEKVSKLDESGLNLKEAVGGINGNHDGDAEFEKQDPIKSNGIHLEENGISSSVEPIEKDLLA